MRAFEREYEHTPGPWKIAKNGRSVLAGGTKINQQSGPCAASCGVQYAIDRTAEANARLIALAPELLVMVKRLVFTGVPTMDGNHYPIPQSLLTQAAELIDTVEGRAAAMRSESNGGK